MHPSPSGTSICLSNQCNEESGNWTKAHLKSKIKNLKLNTQERGAINSDGVRFHAVQSAISDFGFAVGFCPISQFPSSGCLKYIDALFEEGNIGSKPTLPLFKLRHCRKRREVEVLSGLKNGARHSHPFQICFRVAGGGRVWRGGDVISRR